MVGHQYIGKYFEASRRPCFVQGICDDLFDLIGSKYRKPLMGYRGQIVGRIIS